LEEVVDVGLHGGVADEQPLGDLGVGQPAGDQFEHISLTVGEFIERGARA
jgi:hypothetical protein